MFDTDDDATITERSETRGRKPLGGPPRRKRAVILSDMEWEALELADPDGKRNPQAGARFLIAEFRKGHRKAE